MFRRILKLWFTLQLLVLASGAFAAIADDWASGQQAFRDGDYASALLFFEAARDAGLDSPAVYYNIGVSQFKLERYEGAGKTFASIASRFPQMGGLAEYNLGLVARRVEDLSGARAHFLRAYELSSDDRKLRVLSSRRLRELEPEARTASTWTGAIGVRAGHDGNVALRDETGLPVGTTADSPMTDLFASIQGPWNGGSGFRLDGSAYLVKYLDAEEFDQSQVRGGVFYDWRRSDWRIQVGVHASAGTLSGDAFDRKLGAEVSANRYVGRNASIVLRYTHDDVSDADSQFAGISGSRQQFDARYRWYRDAYRLQARFALETNDRVDPGVSPDRIRFGVDYRYQPETGLGFGAGIDFRSSEFSELATSREEDLLTLGGTLTYAWSSDWLLLFELRHSDNDSTDATFSYDRAQVTLGAMRLF
jgi:tetratricopeptide (TPR) repeat protein